MPDFQQQQNNTQSQSGKQEAIFELEIRRVLPVNLYLLAEYAAFIFVDIEGKQIIKRHIRDFNQLFFHVYYYVENVVDLYRLETDNFPQRMNDYFRLYEKMHNNIEYIKAGLELWKEFSGYMAVFGVGRLFTRGIEPEYLDDDDLNIDETLIDEPDEDIIGVVD